MNAESIRTRRKRTTAASDELICIDVIHAKDIVLAIAVKVDQVVLMKKREDRAKSE